MKNVVIIGAGYAGLASALLLLQEGWDVTILEKNDQPGGRARLWEDQGFRFDMGPSWYLMPEVFDAFFARVGTTVDALYGLNKLDPQYKVFFEDHPPVTVTADPAQTRALFDQFEPGGGAQLQRYLDQASVKYRVALDRLLYRPYASWTDLWDRELITKGLRLGLTGSLHTYVRRFFADKRAMQILEYAMVFLGTAPRDAPAMYSLLSHVDLNLGVSFPEGGMNGVARTMAKLVEERGGKLLLGQDVTRLDVEAGRVVRVVTSQGQWAPDAVVNTADYAWSETELLEPRWQTYRRRYWEKRTVAPSMFLMFLGLNRRVEGLEHHNLYFSDDWDQHFDAIFRRPQWPENPCFYLSAISKTDAAMAPPGGENLFLLVPVAAGLEDTDEVRQRYRDLVLTHVEKRTGVNLTDGLVCERIFGPRDFAADYHAWKGTALGLAHTLFQTALFRPGHRSKKVDNRSEEHTSELQSQR